MKKILHQIKITLFFLLTPFCGFATEPSFVIGDLMGQFGNQLFIIAATISLALDHGAVALFPALATEPNFNIPINFEKVFYHLNASQPKKKVEYCYIEPQFSYSKIPFRQNMAIRGWFQSEKYFYHNKEKILELFAPHPEILEYLTNKYESIIQHPNTVSIHYRSYDLEDPEHRVYASCGMEYYTKAIEYFPNDSLFVVFSNDIEWCKKHLPSIPRSFYFVEGEIHYDDFYLMSLCKHQIICNSSFSWWAAYLNSNPNKQVIAPENWFNPMYGASSKDLIPPDWVQVSVQ